jgi:DNA-binding NarL/FixJ family response regulator
MNQSKLLIVDDHPLYREALRQSLASKIGAALLSVELSATVDSALAQIEADHQRTYVVILDILLYGVSSISRIKEFKALSNVNSVVILSGLDDDENRSISKGGGADLFISKNEPSDGMFKLILDLLGFQPDKNRLTHRQLEVLARLVTGDPNKVIADSLGISEQTVKIHIGTIFKELQVSNRTQAVLKARNKNLIPVQT